MPLYVWIPLDSVFAVDPTWGCLSLRSFVGYLLPALRLLALRPWSPEARIGGLSLALSWLYTGPLSRHLEL